MYSAGVVTGRICSLWKVPGVACPGHEALNAWRDIAEVLECACQQLGVRSCHKNSFLYEMIMVDDHGAFNYSCCRCLSLSQADDGGVYSIGLQASSRLETRGILNTCKTEDTRLAMIFATIAPLKIQGILIWSSPLCSFYDVRFSCIFAIRWLQSQSFSQLLCSSSRAGWKWSCSTL